MELPCDFCYSKMAVLFCKADSAKLCLLCDQHVHSANALSLKHVRFKICDSCKNETATIRCSTDNLMLCQNCDWHAHNNCSASPIHERTPAEGLSGCPSMIELASVLGLDLEPKDLFNMDYESCLLEQKVKDFQGSVVPNFHSSVSSALSKGQNLICGNNKDEEYVQIMEMARRNLAKVDGVELSPGTPPSRRVQEGDAENVALNNVKENDLLQQQTPFTSLLMLSDDMDIRKNDYGSEEDGPWDCTPAYRAAQVWDFQSGKSRDCGEPKLVTFVGLEEASLSITKSFQDLCNMNCSTIGVDILSRNDQSDQSSSNHVMKKEESNKNGRGGLSSESKLIESDSGKVTVMENVAGRSEKGSSMIAKVSFEEIAKNRGHAMLRYKEKKKTRRYDRQIRYESRKAGADVRKRVKGRFVKASDVQI